MSLSSNLKGNRRLDPTSPKWAKVGYNFCYSDQSEGVCRAWQKRSVTITYLSSCTHSKLSLLLFWGEDEWRGKLVTSEQLISKSLFKLSLHFSANFHVPKMRLLEKTEILHIFICIVQVGGRYQEALLNNSDARAIHIEICVKSMHCSDHLGEEPSYPESQLTIMHHLAQQWT